MEYCSKLGKKHIMAQQLLLHCVTILLALKCVFFPEKAPTSWVYYLRPPTPIGNPRFFVSGDHSILISSFSKYPHAIHEHWGSSTGDLHSSTYSDLNLPGCFNILVNSSFTRLSYFRTADLVIVFLTEFPSWSHELSLSMQTWSSKGKKATSTWHVDLKMAIIWGYCY